MLLELIYQYYYWRHITDAEIKRCHHGTDPNYLHLHVLDGSDSGNPLLYSDIKEECLELDDYP